MILVGLDSPWCMTERTSTAIWKLDLLGLKADASHLETIISIIGLREGKLIHIFARDDGSISSP
jgi:hypothetical protein